MKIAEVSDLLEKNLKCQAEEDEQREYAFVIPYAVITIASKKDTEVACRTFAAHDLMFQPVDLLENGSEYKLTLLNNRNIQIPFFIDRGYSLETKLIAMPEKQKQDVQKGEILPISINDPLDLDIYDFKELHTVVKERTNERFFRLDRDDTKVYLGNLPTETVQFNFINGKHNTKFYITVISEHDIRYNRETNN